MSSTLNIRFPNETSAEQSRLVSNLQASLAGVEGVNDVAIVKDNLDSQDAGTILTIVLAAPAVVAAVKAIHAWSVRSNQSGLVFESADGTKIIATNLSSNDIPKTIEALNASVSD